MKYLRKPQILIPLFLVLLFLFLGVSQHQLIGYLSEQGWHQFLIIKNAEPLDRFLNDPDFPDEYKQKLKLIGNIREFAVERLGLEDNGVYRTMYDNGDRNLLWLVKAAPPFSVEPYHWHFPIAGSFAYKGYFDKTKAKEEAKRLKAKGYDVWISRVSAWSTLGFLKDPIFSSMLKRKEGDLVELIIHEMTHGTIFLKNDLQFNENLAVFIGENGAMLYLEETYGKDSPELKAYRASLTDSRTFYNHIVKGSERLALLYNSFSELPESEKKKEKETLIAAIIAEIGELSFEDSERYSAYKGFTPNNAWFSGYRTYRADLSEFENDLKMKYNSNLKSYVESLKVLYGKKKNIRK